MKVERINTKRKKFEQLELAFPDGEKSVQLSEDMKIEKSEHEKSKVKKEKK